jgi:hypothetical protein
MNCERCRTSSGTADILAAQFCPPLEVRKVMLADLGAEGIEQSGFKHEPNPTKCFGTTTIQRLKRST